MLLHILTPAKGRHVCISHAFCASKVRGQMTWEKYTAHNFEFFSTHLIDKWQKLVNIFTISW